MRELTNAMRPRVPASQGLPLARPLLMDLPADWWICGQNLAYDTRCAAEGNRVMSTPIGEQLGSGHGVHAGDVSAPGRRSGERAVFARPGTFLTSRALTNQQSNPSASNR